MKYLFLLLVCCSVNKELTTKERVRFEETWWQVDCRYADCPFCFKLSLEESEVFVWYSDDGFYEEGYWSFEEPNTYVWDDGEDVHRIKVVKDDNCFKLHMGIFTEEACKCNLLPKDFETIY